MKNSRNVLLLSFLLLFSKLTLSQCAGVVPAFSLGNDTTICAGETLILSPGLNFDYYLWNNGSNLPSVSGQVGTNSVQVGVVGPNLIVNGDFESGNIGFTTDYIYGTGGTWGLLSTEGQYAISTSPSLTHNNFTSCGDHTSGMGNMLVANGSGTPNTNVWCQNVVVAPNTDYLFSAWITNALNGINVANLQFYVDGMAIGTIFSTNTTGCVWENYNDVWNSGGSTNVTICIVNQNTSNAGNDFAIDDISFAPLCLASDTIIISTNPAPVIVADPAVTICEGESASIGVSSVTPNLTYLWTPGNILGQSITVSPINSTSYSVTATSSLGCESNLVFVPVIVSPIPSVVITALDDSLCLGQNADLTANTTSAVTYNWIGYQNTTATLFDTPQTSTEYSVTVTNNNGCQNSDSLIITVIESLSISISGDSNFCTNESTQLMAIGNDVGIEFVWLPSNMNTPSLTVNSINSGWIYLEGTLDDCPAALDSVFTFETQTPTVSSLSDIEICPGQYVEVTAYSDILNSYFTWAPNNLIGATQLLTSDESITYTVYTQNGDCISDPVSFTIETSLICELEVPNIFTPNNDGVNDSFVLVSSDGITSMECIILNRWGNTVAEFNTPNFEWSGKNQNGNRVNEGTYFYKISAVTLAGDKIEKHGFVQLVR